MFNSPSQLISSSSFDVIQNFIHSEKPVTFSDAKTFCEMSSGHLFSPISPSGISQAKNYLSSQFPDSSSFVGAWTELCSNLDNCKVMHYDDKITFRASNSDWVEFHALCSLNNKSDMESSLIYTCQCPLTFGYENCTDASQYEGVINPGFTYCQSGQTDVEINADSNR